jgi:hypothetical protein
MVPRQRPSTIAPAKRALTRATSAVLRRTIAQAECLYARVARALVESRRHRSAMENELYGGRCRLSTKNDDDLPAGF